MAIDLIRKNPAHTLSENYGSSSLSYMVAPFHHHTDSDDASPRALPQSCRVVSPLRLKRGDWCALYSCRYGGGNVTILETETERKSLS